MKCSDGHLVAEALAHLGDAERDLHAVLCCTFMNCTNIACAVSGRRYTELAAIAASTRRAARGRPRPRRSPCAPADDVADRVHRPEAGAEHQVEPALVAQERRAAVRAHVAGGAALGALEQPRRRAAAGSAGSSSFSCAALARPLSASVIGASLPSASFGALSARKRSPQTLQSTSGSEKLARWPARLPHLGVHDDRRVDADDVLAAVDHEAPPLAHQVALELGAHRPVVVRRAQTAVDLRALEHEAPALAQGHDLLHQLGFAGVGGAVHRAR
jgi:hypothetical protein